MNMSEDSNEASVQSVVHTPGPWEAREVDGLFAIAHPRGWVLESNNEQQDRADAWLIAAAPDLLEALQHMRWCQSCADGSWEDCECGRLAIDAINKATGKKVV